MQIHPAACKISFLKSLSSKSAFFDTLHPMLMVSKAYLVPIFQKRCRCLQISALYPLPYRFKQGIIGGNYYPAAKEMKWKRPSSIWQLRHSGVIIHLLAFTAVRWYTCMGSSVVV